jgi:hypothetical protein
MPPAGQLAGRGRARLRHRGQADLRQGRGIHRAAPDPARHGTAGLAVSRCGRHAQHGLRAYPRIAAILKVGFGLGSDLAQLRARLGIEAKASSTFRARCPRGAEQDHGCEVRRGPLPRPAPAEIEARHHLELGQSAPVERQMLYAADDARSALRVYRAALAEGHLAT